MELRYSAVVGIVVYSFIASFVVTSEQIHDITGESSSSESDEKSGAKENDGWENPLREMDLRERPLFLTPFIEKKEILKALKLSRVVPDILNTTSFTGYITVDKKCGSNLFFWFCRAQSNWETSPVVLWLQGGPGASSLYGLFKEIGPFSYENGIAKERVSSWNLNNNLLFIDQPVGSGFSFTKKGCFAKNKTDINNGLYSTLIQFFHLFPVLKNNNFYISGESYAGHYIPYIALYIHKQNLFVEDKINLKGIMIGNGWMDAYYQYDYSNFLYHMGLIDDKQKESLNNDLLEFHSLIEVGDWAIASNLSYTIFRKTATFLEHINLNNFLKSDLYPLPNQEFVNFTTLRSALHVGSYQFAAQWDEVNYNLVHDNVYNEIQSVRNELEELLEHYPIVFYFGQLDTLCPYSVALKFLRELRWSGAVDYQQAPRRRWCVNDRVVGFYRRSHNLHEVLVRNAGHSVPLDQPYWSFLLADSVTSSPSDDPLQKLNFC